MATKKIRRRGAAIILVALAALIGGPSAALAKPGKSQGPVHADPPIYAPAYGLEASWAEE